MEIEGSMTLSSNKLESNSAPGTGGGVNNLAPNGAEQCNESVCKQFQARQRLLRTLVFTSLYQPLLFIQALEPESIFCKAVRGEGWAMKVANALVLLPANGFLQVWP